MTSETKHEIEKLFEVPARAVDETISFVEKEEKTLISKRPFKIAEEYFETLGPGLTTGAADDDPSGIATYSQAGAQYGLQLIWLAVFTYPFMSVVQEMCARIGIVTGQGLAANIRKHFSARALYVVATLLFLANTLNLAADLGAMAAATQLLLPTVSVGILVTIFALVSLLLQIFTTYSRYAKYLKYLTMALLSYVAVAFAVNLNWGDVLYHTVVPSFSFSRDQIFLLCAILGTTISPYLFFWQTSQEVEELIQKGDITVGERRAEATPQSIRRMRTDVWSGMLFSNLITFFIFAACAGTLYVHGITNIATADQAATALRPFGELAFLLFAVGIVGTGFLAVPVLAGSSAYALSESFGWKNGLYKKLHQAYAFYGIIIISMVVGVLANFMHMDPIKSLIYAAVGNGVIAPIVLYFVVLLSKNKRIMGEHASRPFTTFLGWVTVAFMAISGAAAIWTLF